MKREGSVTIDGKPDRLVPFSPIAVVPEWSCLNHDSDKRER